MKRVRPLPQAPFPPIVRWLFGPLMVVAGGLVLCLAAGWIPAAPSRDQAPAWVIGAAGLAFVSMGLMLMLDGADATRSLRGWLGFMFLVSFAAVFNWIAFGPGERHFTSSTSVGFPGGATTSTSPGSETTGRVLFGIFAVGLDLLIASPLLVAVWRRLRRRT